MNIAGGYKSQHKINNKKMTAVICCGSHFHYKNSFSDNSVYLPNGQN